MEKDIEKKVIFNTNLENLLELSNEDTNSIFNEEMSAAIGSNPTISWAKFILTDDQANENKVRIPKEEFDNLIKTGTYMPFKMAYAKPKEGHDESYPLGVIAQLRKSGNQIVALAALWKKEREEDIDYLKTCIAEKTPINVSWEILHEDSKIDENGIEDLIGTSLRGVTIVGRPAYAGRTPVLQVSSKTADEEIIDSEDNTLDELEKLQTRVSELETDLQTKNSELSEKASELDTLQEELTALREFKQTAEKEREDLERFVAIKELFKTSGIEKTEDYFETNREKLLGLEQEDLEFLVQELVAFSSTINKEENSSLKGGEGTIPDITGEHADEPTIAELAEELRKSKSL